VCRGDHFRFGSVFIKKNNQTKIFLIKKTETEPKPGQTDRFRFGFLVQKPVQTGLAWFFSILAWFFWFGSVFPVWLGFFSVSVRFGFFSFLFTKPNRPVFLKF